MRIQIINGYPEIAGDQRLNSACILPKGGGVVFPWTLEVPVSETC